MLCQNMLNLNCFTFWLWSYYAIHVLVICLCHRVPVATLLFTSIIFVSYLSLIIFVEFLPFLGVVCRVMNSRQQMACCNISDWENMPLYSRLRKYVSCSLFLVCFEDVLDFGFYFIISCIISISHVFITSLLGSGVVL